MPSLERLAAGPHGVCVVVSQPDRRRGRGRRTSPSPVAQWASAAALPLLRPERVGAPEVVAQLRSFAPDLGVVVAFGQFLPRPVRDLPRLGYLINAHASLLPRHRGAAPVQHAILAGDSRTGISVMRVERRMDAGPVARSRALAIDPEEDAGQLAGRLARLAAELLAEVVDAIAADAVTWTPQDEAEATAAPRIERADARLHWERGAGELVRRVRAMAPEPGAETSLDGQPLRILAARSLPGPTQDRPGTVRLVAGELRVATGDGWLVPLRLQRSGGRALAAADYLRGRPIADGARLA